jgi:diacylglycerol kinase family enzyme
MSVDGAGAPVFSSPRDGYLETIFRPSPRRGLFSKFFRPAAPPGDAAKFPVRQLSIRHHQPVTVLRDGQRLSSSVLDIQILPQHLRVITGKQRKFE